MRFLIFICRLQDCSFPEGFVTIPGPSSVLVSTPHHQLESRLGLSCYTVVDGEPAAQEPVEISLKKGLTVMAHH